MGAHDRDGAHGESAQRHLAVLYQSRRQRDARQFSAERLGYCVFGKVIEGMDVLDAIAATPTGNKGGMQDVPMQTVTIESTRRAS